MLITSLAIAIIAVFTLVKSIGRLIRSRAQSDIRVVFYLFSLALILTWVGTWAALAYGAIDAQGQYHGRAGMVLLGVLHVVFDLKGDLKLLVAAAAVVILPQALSWLLSAIFGCANTVILVRPTFRFVLWTFVKSCTVGGGVALGIGSASSLLQWSPSAWLEIQEGLCAALVLLACAFLLLSMYRSETTSNGRPNASSGPVHPVWYTWAQRFARRNMEKP